LNQSNPISQSGDTGDAARFRLYSLDELYEIPDPEWLIKPILPRGSLVELYGKSGNGKSFVALDWGLSLSAGLIQSSANPDPLHVIYICAEGGRGIKKRIKAWLARHPDANRSKFWFLPQPVNMLHDKDVIDLGLAIQELGGNIGLIVVDTLARCFGDGDENMTRDMNCFVGSCQSLIQWFPDSTVLVVHHTGKDAGRKDRGSTALRAASDTVIELQRSGNGPVTLKCEKQKDWEPFEDLRLRLDVIELEDGETSCVVEIVETGHEKPAPKGNALKALTILTSFEEGGATATDWKEKFVEEAGKSESVFYRALDKLQEGGYVMRPGDSTKGEPYSLTEKGREAVTVK